MPQFKVTFLGTLILVVSSFTQANDFFQHHEVLHSKSLNEDRRAIVQIPRSYASDSEREYPVIYLLDGMDNLPMVSGMLNRLQQSDIAPELIIVAIENTDRLRDLTPTVNYDPRGPAGKGGGGDKFLDFIEMELIPHINQKYRTHDFKIFLGASIGGLLVIHSLQSRPHLFQAHMAFSPAVWWGDRTTVKKTKEFISKAKALDNYLYLNIGEEGGDMRTVYDDLHSFLQKNKPENLKLKTDAFDTVPHGLTAAAGVFNAFQNLFLPLNMPPQELTYGMKSVHSYFSRVSQQRGKTISPSERVINGLGHYLVDQNDLSTAIELFKFNTKQHSNSAIAHNSLAYAYEKNGQIKNSLKQVNLALTLSKESDSGYDVYIQRKNRLISAAKSAMN
jgi:predicted alpha/beta superfamily hydrolase